MGAERYISILAGSTLPARQRALEIFSSLFVCEDVPVVQNVDQRRFQSLLLYYASLEQRETLAASRVLATLRGNARFHPVAP